MRSPSLFALLLLLIPCIAQAQPSSHGDVGQLGPRQSAAQLAGASVSFTENRGQWPEQVRLAAQLKGLDLWITNSSILYDPHTIQAIAEERNRLDPAAISPPATTRRRGHLILMEFAGASGASATQGTAPLPGHRNYFIGNDPARWASEVPTYASARMQGLYPGIDAVLYFEEGLPRYDIMVAPQADPSAVRIRFNGAERVWITRSGELAMKTSMGTLYQRKLFAYQNKWGRRHQVQCAFKRHGDGTVGFSLGAYDRSLPLVIDPLLYSTFFGGGASDGARALITEGADNIYFTGYTGGSSPFSDKFPATYGAYDITERGGNDVFVAKIKSSTGALIFSTLIGGSKGDEGTDIMLGQVAGTMRVCGVTSSEDFPTTAGAFSTRYNGGTSDGFILYLNNSGSMLVFSTFIGGARGDGIVSMLRESGDIIRFCGYTLSDDFPTTADAYDPTYNGDVDIFSAVMDATGSTLLSSTYIGGSGADLPSAIKPGGRSTPLSAYIVATTLSADLPTTSGAIDRSYNGGTDVAILRVSADNTRLEYGTYLGGSRDDHGRDIAIPTSAGEVFVGGYTASEDFPTSAGAYDRSFNGGTYDAFAARVGINTGRLVYSTYLGGSGDDYCQVIAPYERGLGTCQGETGPPLRRLWVAGYTISGDFPINPHVATFDSTKDGAHDGFISLLSDRGDSLIYTTFIGGEERDAINDLATYTTCSGNSTRQMLYFCGTTVSFNFPTTPQAYDRKLAPVFNAQTVPAIGSYDAFLGKLLPATIILLTESPGSLVRLCPTGTYAIRWKSFDINVLTVDLLTESGRMYHSNLLTNYPGDAGNVQDWDWMLPVNQPPGEGFRVSVRDFDLPSPGMPIAADTGMVDFEIIAGPKLIRGIEDIVVCPGTPAELSALAAGLELKYVWRKNGFTLFGATRPALRIDSVTAADTGTYELIVLDACGSVALTEIVRVDLKPGASIIAQPVDTEICPGFTASFNVQAEDDDALYQWYKDGEMIPDATASTLLVRSADQDDNGYYYCEVANAACPSSPVRSRAARLIVFYETIQSQPGDTTVQVGTRVHLYVGATGLHPTYQWRKDGIPIPGATISSYNIQRAAFSDAGRYDVIVNGECSLTSAAAILTVTDAIASAGERPEQAQGRSLLVQPNPATGRTTIRIASAGADGILRDPELALYDLLGRKVLDLTGTFAESGYLAAEFDARQLPPGIYYCRLAAGGTSSATSVIITR